MGNSISKTGDNHGSLIKTSGLISNASKSTTLTNFLDF